MKNLKRINGTTVKQILINVIDLHNEMANCYFWRPPSDASSRRKYEKNHSIGLKFALNDVEYDIDQSTTCSCKNIYYNLSVYVDGIKKNVTAIKNLLK